MYRTVPQDEFYNRYLVKNHLLGPVVAAFLGGCGRWLLALALAMVGRLVVCWAVVGWAVVARMVVERVAVGLLVVVWAQKKGLVIGKEGMLVMQWGRSAAA